MKLKFILPLLFYGFLSCSKSPKEDYEGYVYCDGNPVEGVRISESDLKKPNSTLTNKSGYFKFKRSIDNYVSQLLFIKDGYKGVEIPLASGTRKSTIFFYFLRKKSDTLRMIKLEK